jgi:hypothetical protein
MEHLITNNQFNLSLFKRGRCMVLRDLSFSSASTTKYFIKECTPTTIYATYESFDMCMSFTVEQIKMRFVTFLNVEQQIPAVDKLKALKYKINQMIDSILSEL